MLQPVEWVLVVYYGPAAHQPTYGRQVRAGGYTKDYIQLSRKREFLDAMASLFSVNRSTTGSVPLTYEWPTGTAPGAFVFTSADRAHLKWETNRGAPGVWKMSLSPDDSIAETIPGDPTHTNFADAEREYALIPGRGGGQPYLMAIKLVGEPRTLHLRAYLKNPSAHYAWADLNLLPPEIQALCGRTSQRSALAWSLYGSGGAVATRAIEDALSQLSATENPPSAISVLDAEAGRALTTYLQQPGYGLFFDPARNHDAWHQPNPLPSKIAASLDAIVKELEARYPPAPRGDAAAEQLEVDPAEVEAFRRKIGEKSYEVDDTVASRKTRGSAQRAFAEAVKANYGNRCAITGISTREFLVGSHIVPWSEDKSIRLDPSNGICLSIFADRAFEKGYLQIDNDLTVRIDWTKVGVDTQLRSVLEPFDGKKLEKPVKHAPSREYLGRRRAGFSK